MRGRRQERSVERAGGRSRSAARNRFQAGSGDGRGRVESSPYLMMHRRSVPSIKRIINVGGLSGGETVE